MKIFNCSTNDLAQDKTHCSPSEGFLTLLPCLTVPVEVFKNTPCTFIVDERLGT